MSEFAEDDSDFNECDESLDVDEHANSVTEKNEGDDAVQ